MIDESIAKTTAINWQDLDLLNPRNLGGDQDTGIKSVTSAI
jgi:hypothetical protein